MAWEGKESGLCLIFYADRKNIDSNVCKKYKENQQSRNKNFQIT